MVMGRDGAMIMPRERREARLVLYTTLWYKKTARNEVPRSFYGYVLRYEVLCYLVSLLTPGRVGRLPRAHPLTHRWQRLQLYRQARNCGGKRGDVVLCRSHLA
jgi:hypothetical protein